MQFVKDSQLIDYVFDTLTQQATLSQWKRSCINLYTRVHACAVQTIELATAI